MSESSDLQSAVETLTKTIDGLREELVRKDVYAVDQRLMSERVERVDRDMTTLGVRIDKTVSLIEKAEERRAADRRLILTALVLPVVLIVIQLYLAAQTGGAS